MDLPIVISRLVGYYAVTSLYDLELLVRSGFLKPHRQALHYTTLAFQDVAQAVRAISLPMFAGLRTLQVDQVISNACLERLTSAALNLEELDLGQCRGVTHTHSLGKLHTLRKLTMAQCSCYYGFFTDTLSELNLTQCGPLSGDFTSLTKLTLDGCTIQKPFLKLGHTLRHLVIRSNCFVECDWEEPDFTLDGLTNLETLEITDSSFENRQATAIGSMKCLTSLSLKGCTLLSNYHFLQGLHALRSLHVERNFDWSMLKHLKLHIFSVREYHNQDLCHLVTQNELRCLRLDQARSPQGDPAEVLSTLVGSMPRLSTLDLFYCTHLLTTHGFQVCPQVKCLKIDFCKLVDDSRLQALMRSFPNVEILSANFTQVSDAGLACLHTNMRDLSFRGCNLTSAALPFLKPMRFLESLDIAYTKVHQVTALPKSLRTLDISGCESSMFKILRNKRIKVTHSFFKKNL